MRRASYEVPTNLPASGRGIRVISYLPDGQLVIKSRPIVPPNIPASAANIPDENTEEAEGTGSISDDEDPVVLDCEFEEEEGSSETGDEGDKNLVITVTPKDLSSNIKIKAARLQKDNQYKIWKCERCPKVFKHQSSLSSHITMSVEENSPGECALCKAQFCLANDLKLHLLQHAKSGVPVTFNCDKCKRVFKNHQSLSIHKELSTQEIGKDGILTCNRCQQVFCLNTDLQIHIAHHDSERSNNVWDCHKCSKVLKSRTVLANHIYLGTLEDEILECKTCQKRFCLKRDLRKHVVIHNITEKFECNICNKQYKCKRNLGEHMAMHGEPRFKCTVEDCDRMFQTKKTLRRHIESHNTERNFKCDICDKSFRSNQVLKCHKGIHAKSHKCEHCGKLYATVTLLRSHQINIHGREAPFRCSVCGKGSPSQMQLTNHLRTHTGERPYPCDVCGKSFAAKKNLKDHKTCVHRIDAKWNCTLCEMTFSSEKKLNIHMGHRHMGIKPFVCEYCGKGFPMNSGLVSHRRVHTGETPYQCGICKHAFKNSGNLRIHMRVHSGEKPYACHVCGKRSSCFANFKKHWKIHPPKTLTAKRWIE